MNIKAPILWEKTYYQNDLIDKSKDLRGKETGDWRQVLFLFRFLILKYSSKNRFLIEPLIEELGGNSEQEMVETLEQRLDGMDEWVLKGKHWRDSNIFPEEVNQKLVEFNLEKYVKKVS